MNTCIVHESEYKEIEETLDIENLFIQYLITGKVYKEEAHYIESIIGESTTKAEYKDEFYYYGCGFSFNGKRFAFNIAPVLSEAPKVDSNYSPAFWRWETTTGYYDRRYVIGIIKTREKMLLQLSKTARKIVAENKTVIVFAKPIVNTFSIEEALEVPCNINTPLVMTAKEHLTMQINKHNNSLI